MTDREKAAQNYSASRVNDPKDPREIEHFKAGWDAHAKKAEALVEALQTIAHNYPGDPVIGITAQDVAREALQAYKEKKGG